MDSNIPTMPTPVKLTKIAAEMAISVMKEEGLENHGLRIAITGGGCTGLQYVLDFAENLKESSDEMVYDQHGIQIIIDCYSASHLMGTTIEYHDTLNSTGFKFNNPNKEQRKCGCGSSFGY